MKLVVIILVFIQLYHFYLMWQLKKDVNDKTEFFWKEDGDGNRILMNNKGEEILKI